MQVISFNVHTFKEGKMYIAYVPELDLSSAAPLTRKRGRTFATPSGDSWKPVRKWGLWRKFSKKPATSMTARHGERRNSYPLID